MLRLEENAEETFGEDVNLELESSADSHSFLPIPRKEPTKYTAIHSIIHNVVAKYIPNVSKLDLTGHRKLGIPKITHVKFY